jgi:hypothetical protein
LAQDNRFRGIGAGQRRGQDIFKSCIAHQQTLSATKFVVSPAKMTNFVALNTECSRDKSAC